MDKLGRLKNGTKYRVTLEDCCVHATFTATLVEINIRGDKVFDNGVRVLEGGRYEVVDEGVQAPAG